eukprot:4197397-Pyramimonas_sp.AAC.1
MPAPTTGGGALVPRLAQPLAQQPAGGSLVHERALLNGTVQHSSTLGAMHLRETAGSPLRAARDRSPY